ncbi:MAG: helix-turn-helix domain-containing protein [Acidobacteriota bacterium]|nr:helix-turn-helix domain-containing protein [Acidobacteriota bacterium]
MSTNLRFASASKQPHFLTVREVADLLRRKRRTIYEMVARDQIPYRKVGGMLLFDLDEVVAWTKNARNK